jgi:hypothetical protein
MRSGVNIALAIWDEGDDAYDHTELAANWDAIDAHDHSAGKGKQITSAGLASDSVGNSQLAPNSVTTTEIADHTIQSVDIAPGAIGSTEIDPDIFNSLAPLGMIVPWFRPSTAFALPTGWHVCDGAVVNSADHSWTGAGNVTLPDLRNRFVLGAATTGTGTTPGAPPAENATGGAHTRTFNHSHTVAGHSHTVNAHSHTVNAHSHTVNSHSHGVNTDGEHHHTWLGNNLSQRPYEISSGGTPRQATYVPGFNEDNSSQSVVMDSIGAHNHGGGTGSSTPGTSTSSPGTSDASPGTTSVTLTTDATAPGGDLRPAFVGLLYIIKVKNG